MMIDTSELYSLILVRLTLVFLRCESRKGQQNLLLIFSDNMSLDCVEIKHAATICIASLISKGEILTEVVLFKTTHSESKLTLACVRKFW